MDPPKQIYENSMPWRIFNVINYLMGGALFLAGSILSFPSLTDVPVIDAISIWFFIIGSFNFVLADGISVTVDTKTMEPKSTLENSLRWKLWHSINYLFGGISFFIGSATLFPHLNRYFPAAIISAWFYTIGSFTFLLADITEWLHYVYWNCRYLWYAFNFLLSVIGSALYLVGSACFLPQIKQNDLGYDFLIVASSFVIVAQTLKLLKGFSSSKQNSRETFKEDPSGIFVDFFAGIGGMGYWIGSFFFFQKLSVNPNLVYQGASFFTLGGIFFEISALFMQKRYYCEYPVQENSLMPSDQ